MKKFYFPVMALATMLPLTASAGRPSLPPVDAPYERTDSLPSDTAGYWKQYNIGEVSVTATRKLVKSEIGKLSYDMTADDEAKTKNTLDMLRKVPMVSVDGQDNIRVKGSTSFKIYRNGHPDPSLDGTSASKILKSIPANTIKKIEVITDPGAKYDAEGTSVILNIVMKDNAGLQGIAGNVNAGFNTRGSIEPSASITAQKGPFTMAVNYGFSHRGKKGSENETYSDTYYGGNGESHSYVSYNGPVDVHYGNISASWEIDSLNLLSLSGGGWYVLPDLSGHYTSSRSYGHIGLSDSSLPSGYSYDGLLSTPDYKFYNFNGRMDFQHNTHLDGEVFTLSYMGVTTRQNQDMLHAYSNLLNVPFSYTGYSQRQHEKFFEHTVQADYVRPFGKNNKLEMGLKYINRSNKSNTQMIYTGDDTSNVYSLFDHTTQVGAAYLEWLGNFGAWNFRAGLRYEHSYMKASFPDGSSDGFSKRLNDWCPTASVQYRLRQADTFTATWSTNIRRPGIEYLNPARVETPTEITEGAPGLSSTRNQQFSLTWMHVGKNLTLSLSPSFFLSNNQITAVQGVQNGKTWTSYDNVNRERSFYTTAYVQTAPWKNASLSVDLGGGYHYYRNPNIGLSLDGWHANYNVNYRQKLPWRLSFNGGVGGSMGREPESVYSLGGNWFYHYLTLQRSFLKEDRLTVSLTAMSPFEHHGVWKQRTVQGDYTASSRTIYTSQSFALRLSWRFGTLKTRVKTVERSIDNNDVVGGIKQAGASRQ